ncbi:MAG: hypothetical protein LBU46_07115 [Candidatus Accumulibacter sp.]|jgi:hypothetical protein|nr:hypothetical protein [Accumulibacter sp.]
MHRKWVTYSIATLYFVFGIFLYVSVPAFHAIYAGIFNNWTPGSDPLIAPFFWLACVWPFSFGTGAFLPGLSTRMSAKARQRINYIALPLFLILALYGLDWLYGFLFCHTWGCSFHLPTWKLLY